MDNVVDLWVEEGRAQGRAEALALTHRILPALIRRLVDRGDLSREGARAELQTLMKIGDITREIGQVAISQLQ